MTSSSYNTITQLGLQDKDHIEELTIAKAGLMIKTLFTETRRSTIGENPTRYYTCTTSAHCTESPRTVLSNVMRLEYIYPFYHYNASRMQTRPRSPDLGTSNRLVPSCPSRTLLPTQPPVSSKHRLQSFSLRTRFPEIDLRMQFRYSRCILTTRARMWCSPAGNQSANMEPVGYIAPQYHNHFALLA